MHAAQNSTPRITLSKASGKSGGRKVLANNVWQVEALSGEFSET